MQNECQNIFTVEVVSVILLDTLTLARFILEADDPSRRIIRAEGSSF